MTDLPDWMCIRAHQNHIGCAFLDITLPGISSREVFEEAQRIRLDLRMIVTSAYGEEKAAASLGAGVGGFVRKPYRLSELADLIGKQGNAGMRPERRFKPGRNGGLRAAVLVSPPLYLSTAVFLSKRPGPAHFSPIPMSAVHGEEDELDPGQGTTNLPDRLDPVHFGHGNIRNDDIRLQFEGSVNQRVPV